MSRFPKPCLICGVLSLGNKCEQHQAQDLAAHQQRRSQIKRATGQYSGNYRKRAKAVRETALFCHICGDPARINDPWEADHIEPGTQNTELRAAHRSCNQRRGNKPLT